VRHITLPVDDRSLDSEMFGGNPVRPDRRVASALDAWFAGRRRTFDLAVDLDGLSPFRRIVLETLAHEVPWGETVTYGELAALTGRPGAARATGSALRANPVPFVVPCHRVTAADGIGGYGGRREAVALKRTLLDRERASTPR
jgi:methylated-DNA-[protein]-cysteine S-methyltransferase